MTSAARHADVPSPAGAVATILKSFEDGVLTLTLNRPAALNSFTAGMHAELRVALDAAAQDGRVRCVVLTGTGRAFCTGQDLSDLEAGCDLGQVLSRDY